VLLVLRGAEQRRATEASRRPVEATA